ncbi:MAG: M24 family metallopeptidase [Phycisphaerae bacterium]
MVKKKTQVTAAALVGRRTAALNRARKDAKADALLITRPEDVSYLTGFTGGDSAALLTGKRTVLVTDGRYSEQAQSECPGVEVHSRSKALLEVVAEYFHEYKANLMAVQGGHMTVVWAEALGKYVGKGKLVSTRELVTKLREEKDESEVAAVRRSIGVAEKAFAELVGQGRKAFVGRSEREVAAELDYRMRCGGASASAFETIVAAGTNGSKPHYRPSDRKIGRHEPVLIDWGALVEGYCSDLTRVVFTGRIPAELAEVYSVVLRAQKAGIDAIRPGVACKTVDAAARKVIEDAGYGEAFVHGLGHGIGREIHERPHVAGSVTDRLRSGMITTVEPGIYLPGIGGVRIEDDVLVTAKGRRKLTSLPRDMKAMVLS